MDLASGDKENLTEGYYNFQLTERLRLSFSLQHVLDRAGEREQVRLLAARRSSAGGVLGCQVRGQESDTSCSIQHGASSLAASWRARGRHASPRVGHRAAQAPAVKITDPTSVVMIVNRDSNDIGVHGHQDEEDDRQRLPRQQRQPAHGDDVARRALRRHRRHAREQGVHHRRAHAAAGQDDSRRHRARAPVVLARQPLVLPGQSGRRFDLGDRHGVVDEDQDDSRLRRAAQRHVPAGRVEGLRRQLRRALGGRRRRPAARAAQEDPGRRRARRRQAGSGQVPGRDQGHQHRRAVERRQVPVCRRRRPGRGRRHRSGRRQGHQGHPRRQAIRGASI